MARPTNVGVGVAVIVVSPECKLLMLKRKGAHAAGCWAFPGGWVDFDDKDIRDAATRELWEEVGIKVERGHVRTLGITTEVHDDLGVRGVTIYFMVPLRHCDESFPPYIREPEKAEELQWVSPLSLPTPIFPNADDAVLQLFKLGMGEVWK